MRFFGTAAFLTGLWLLMSGIYKPLIVGFGLASVLLVTLVVTRMDRIDGDRVAMRLRPLTLARYIVWLLVEIARSNWAVTRMILAPGMPIRPNLFAVPYTQKTDLGQVLFANSITLTPGTLTVETGQGHFLVHALVWSDGDLDALAEMDRRCAAVEIPEPA